MKHISNHDAMLAAIKHALHYIETPGDFTETERLELCDDLEQAITNAEKGQVTR